MEVHSLQDIEKALKETREEFCKTTIPIRDMLDMAVSQFVEAIDLTKAVAKDTDDEKYALEVLATAFRRVIASMVLLESGLPQEAHIVLRNALELMLIAIEIIYNRASLEEWKKTVNDDLKNINHDDWYFVKSKICRRIDKNEKNLYPELERRLALGLEGVSGHGICKEWQIISNMSVHAHSQAQIRQLFDSSGNLQLLGRKTVDSYEKDFAQYQIFIVNIISLLIGIPRYRDLIGRTESLSARANRFAENYSKLLTRMNVAAKIMEKNI
jgi:hypothetical protein